MAASSESVFDIGEWWNPTEAPPRNHGLTERDKVEQWWRNYLYEEGLARPHPNKTDKRVAITPLTDWYRDDSIEVFEVALRGRTVKTLDELASSLRTARHAHDVAVTTVDGASGLVQFILNHSTLPAFDRFNPELVPDDPDLFYLGTLGCGPPAIYNPEENPHALICGGTGSGKSVTASMVLGQAHRKSSEILVATPTVDDVNFTMFGELGHEVFTNVDADVETMTAFTERLEQVPVLMKTREKQTAAAGRASTPLPWMWIVLDEIGWLIAPVDTNKQMNELRARTNAAVTQIVQRGRRSRVNLVGLTQEPRATQFGGDRGILGQIHLRMGIRKLEAHFQGAIFNPSETEKDVIKRVLSNASTPPGRAIVRGICEPTDEHYLGFPVHNQPMQVACMDPDEEVDLDARRAYVGLPPINDETGVMPTKPPSPVRVLHAVPNPATNTDTGTETGVEGERDSDPIELPAAVGAETSTAPGPVVDVTETPTRPEPVPTPEPEPVEEETTPPTTTPAAEPGVTVVKDPIIETGIPLGKRLSAYAVITVAVPIVAYLIVPPTVGLVVVASTLLAAAANEAVTWRATPATVTAGHIDHGVTADDGIIGPATIAKNGGLIAPVCIVIVWLAFLAGKARLLW